MSEGHSPQTGFKIASNGVSTRANLDDDGNVQVVVMSGGGGGGGGACTIADAADVVEGALADAAIVTDAAGTVSGKLRGLVKIFADIWDSTNNFFRAGPKTTTTTGTIAGAAQTVNLSLNGKYASASFQLLATGGPSGFLAVEVSVDSGVTYFAAECWNPVGSGTGPIISSNSIDVSVNTSGLWVVPLPPGATNLKFRENSWVAGSWALSVAASTFPAMDWVRMGQPIISAPTNGGGAGQQMLVTKGGAATYLIDSTTGSAVTVNGANLADAFANPANVSETQTFPYNYNGATWDRQRGDTTNGLDVDVTRSALPTGAATLAAQTQPGVDIGDVTINNAAGASAVNIQDGGNSITVDSGDTTGATVALNANGVRASVALAGQQGAGVFVATGTLTNLGAFLTPYLSFDGGTTWIATNFISVGGLVSSLLIVGGIGTNPSLSSAIEVVGGATHASVVLSGRVAGTADCNLIATRVKDNQPVTTIQGSPSSLSNGWPVKITDGSEIPAVKAASTAAVAADAALVVAVSPNNTVPVSNTVLSVVGGGTEAAAQRVTIANNSTGVVGITAATLPLPTGAATALRQDTGNTSLANLDVLLSTRLKAADTLAAVTTVGTITNPVTVAQPTGTNLHVVVDSMPAVSSSTSADVVAADGDAGYTVGDLAKNLTQTDDGRLRAIVAGLVSDTVQSYQDGVMATLSLNGEGRLRVATASESYNFSPWGSPESWGSDDSYINGSHPLSAW